MICKGHQVLVVSPHPRFSAPKKASIDAELQGQQKKRKKRWEDLHPSGSGVGRFREEITTILAWQKHQWANSSHFHPKSFAPSNSSILKSIHCSNKDFAWNDLIRDVWEDILRPTASMHHHPFILSFLLSLFTNGNILYFSGRFQGSFSVTQLPASIDNFVKIIMNVSWGISR